MIFSADFKQCGIKHTIYKHLTGAHTGALLRNVCHNSVGAGSRLLARSNRKTIATGNLRPRPPTHTNNHRKFRGIFTTANQNNFNELIAVPCTAVSTALIKIIPSSTDEGIDFIFYSYYCVIVPRGVRYMF